jgi:hypothetical protein
VKVRFHLGEHGEEQERDAADAVVGDVDRERVSEGSDANAAFGAGVDEVEDFASC